MVIRLKYVKIIIILSLNVFILMYINKSLQNNQYVNALDNINNLLDNSPEFIATLKMELSKKYPAFIVSESLNNYKSYQLDATDLYVEIYSNLLQSNINVYIDCKDLAMYNLGCKIDNNYINKNTFTLDKAKKQLL